MGSHWIRALLAALVFLSTGAAVAGTTPATKPLLPTELKPALDAVDAGLMLEQVKTLSSDKFGGRAPASQGEELTLGYLTEQFRRAGLQPGNPDGSYLQRVPLVGITAHATLAVSGTHEPFTLDPAKDFVLRSRHRQAQVQIHASPIVFVGYGITAPEYGWDDFSGLDLRGKTVLMLDGEPELAAAEGDREPPFKGTLQTYYSTRSYKYEHAAKLGAAVVLVVHADASLASFTAVQNSYRREFFVTRADPGVPATAEGWITRDATTRLFRAQGLDFAAAVTTASSAARRPLTLGATLDLDLVNTIRKVDSYNVIARLEGSDAALHDTAVLYSAHWDHLGTDPTLAGDRIYNGAIDNAGGVAMLLQIARGFAALPRAPRRSLLFVATTAEEIGLLGARHYASFPLVPIDRTVAVFNLDSFNAWGETSDVMNMGLGLTTLDEVLERAGRVQGRTFIHEAFAGGSYFYASDQLEFAKAGIPAAFPGSGSDYIGKPKGYGDSKWGAYGASGYHQVGDEVQDDWDLSGAVQDVRWLLLAGYEVAESADAPQWISGAGFARRVPAPAP